MPDVLKLVWFFLFFCFFCRPHSEDEKRSKAPQVISCNESRREVTVLQNLARNQIDRTFTFDKVCLLPQQDGENC